MRVLVTAASRHGATAEIAEAIGRGLAERGLQAAVLPPERVESLAGHDAVVLGSAVYEGRWLPPARDLARRLRLGLLTRPVWLFSSGPVGEPSGWVARAMGADPLDVADMAKATGARGHRVFAGRLDRRHLTLAQWAARAVVGGPEGDFRDWAAIDAWAGEITSALRASPAPAPGGSTG